MVLQDQEIAKDRCAMRVKDKELLNIIGGSDVAGTLLNYLSTAIKTVFDVGQQLGGAIRRIATGKICPL